MVNKEKLREEFYEFIKNDELKTEDICAFWLEKVEQSHKELEARVDGLNCYFKEEDEEGIFPLIRKVDVLNIIQNKHEKMAI